MDEDGCRHSVFPWYGCGLGFLLHDLPFSAVDMSALEVAFASGSLWSSVEDVNLVSCVVICYAEIGDALLILLSRKCVVVIYVPNICQCVKFCFIL